MKRATKLILITVALALLIIFTLSALPAENTSNVRKSGATLSPIFDHSQCQYPDRSTNPVDGCDNSDPCDPANTKGGSGDCSPIIPAPEFEAAEIRGK